MSEGKPTTAGHTLVWDGTKWVEGYPQGLNISSQQQGDLIYYNGSNWVRLAAGTSGNFLQTTGANPVWASIGGSMPSRVTPLDANHIHAWELTDANGSTTILDTGNTSAVTNLTASSSPTPTLGVPGLLGNCSYSSASSSYWTTGNINGATGTSPGADFPSAGDWSIECWFKSSGYTNSSSANYNIVATSAGGALQGLNIKSVSTGWVLLMSIGSANSIAATLSVLPPQAGTWVYWVATYNFSTGVFKFYVNGELLYTSASGRTPPSWTGGNPAYFGINGNTNNTSNGQAGALYSRVRMSNIERSLAYIQSTYKTAMYY